MNPCVIDGCSKVCDTHRGGGHGMCSMHYGRWRRGKLDKPRYSRPTGAAGMNISFPFEVDKIAGIWHRRPTGSKLPWEQVVWPKRDRPGLEPQDTRGGW